ncbi:MAG: NAD-dependent epimerase/dehydratase family protein [Candidatus Hodarchaeales archaeon]
MAKSTPVKSIRVLITGANGFVGSNLTKYLSRDPSLKVYAMVRSKDTTRFLKDFQYKENSTEKWFEMIEANLNDEESIIEACKNIDVIIHLAGLVSDWGKKDQFWEMNVEGTRKVLAGASKTKVKRVLYLSSLTVHGLNGHTYDTEEASREVKEFTYAVTNRPGYIIYGPYDKNSYVKALDQMTKGRFALINGGRRLISHVYVENLCYGIGQLIKAESVNAAYNILDGNMTWKEWIVIWEKAINRKIWLIRTPYFLLVPITALLVGIYKLFRIKKSPPLNFYRIKVMRKDLAFVNKRIITELGYAPPTKLEEGIQKTLEYYNSKSSD